VIPGETALLIGGPLAGVGHVDVVAVAASGIAGAVIGDSVGHEVGRRRPSFTRQEVGPLVRPQSERHRDDDGPAVAASGKPRSVRRS